MGKRGGGRGCGVVGGDQWSEFLREARWRGELREAIVREAALQVRLNLTRTAERPADRVLVASYPLAGLIARTLMLLRAMPSLGVVR